MKPQSVNAVSTGIKSQWFVVASYGARIRLAGESLEACQGSFDDFEIELAAVERAVEKIREQIAFIRGHKADGHGAVKLNREMYLEAVAACQARKGMSPEDLPRELELELFGSEAP